MTPFDSSGALPMINVQQLKALRDAGEAHLVLDVREASELQAASLDGALHVPLMTLPDRVSEIPADMPVVVMCHHGMRSMNAVQWLRANGMDNVVNLIGGISAWAREVDPSVGSY